jgi:pantetheine-phosphate adenylyltransferase
VTDRVGLYPGTFDPVTLGHADIVRRGAKLVDRLIVGVTTSSAKSPMFSFEERVAMMEAEIVRLGLGNVDVRGFDALLMKFAESIGASVIVRGLRAVADFEYEYQMALMNRHLAPDLETMFMVPSLEVSYLSSSLVREVARFGGDIDKLVHPKVAEALRKKFPPSSFPANPGPSSE